MGIVSTGEFTIIDVNDGLNGRLTLDSIMIPTSNDGSGGDYSTATTTMSVWLGKTDDTANWTVIATPSAGLSGQLVGTTYTVTGLVQDAGYVDLTATRQGFAPVTSRFTVSKAKQGHSGRVIWLAQNAIGFTFTDRVAKPAQQTIAITVIRNSPLVTGPVTFYASNGAVLETDKGQVSALQHSLGYPDVGQGDTCYVKLSDLGDADQMYVTAVLGELTAVASIVRLDFSTAEAGATRNVFKGAWEAGKAYSQGDQVVNEGAGWQASVAHVSAEGNKPPSFPATSNATWAQAAAKGDRGTIVTAQPVAGTTWSDAEADAAVVTAGGIVKQKGDVVTLHNAAGGFSQTRVWTGTVWFQLAAFYGGDVLVDGTVIAGKLAAGSVSTNNLQAGVVTASKVVVADTTNAFPDYDCVDPAFYTSTHPLTINASGSAFQGKNYYQIAASAGQTITTTSGWFPVTRDANYRVSGSILQDTAEATSTVTLEIEFATMTSGGAINPTTKTLVGTKTNSASATTVETNVTIAAQDRRARFVITRTGAGGASIRFAALAVQLRANASLIVDGAITAGKIFTDAVTAGTIAAGAVNAREIAAGAVTASKMLVADTTNIWPDYDMADPGMYASSTGHTMSFSGEAGGDVGKNRLQVNSNNTTTSVEGAWQQIEAGAELLCRGSFWFASTSGGPVGQLEVELGSMDATGVITPTRRVVVLASTGTSQTPGSVNVTATSTERRIRFVASRTTTGSGSMRTSGWYIMRRAKGELIVDGAITAAKVGANEVIANVANIKDGLITNAKIADLHASKLTAGSITADKMGANSITTNSLTVTGNNLCGNSDFATGTFADWFPSASSGSQFVKLRTDPGVPAGAPTKYVVHWNRTVSATVGLLQGPSANDETGFHNDGIPVEAGDVIRTSVWMVRAAGGTSQSFILRGLFLLTDGTVTTVSHGALVTNATMTANAGIWTLYEGYLPVPANAVRMRCNPFISGFVGDLYLTKVTYQRMAGSTLIEDGAITVNKLQADVLNANNINAGQMSVARLNVDTLLNVDAANGGIAVGKGSAYAVEDGIYMGRTTETDQSVGFGVAASRTVGGVKQSFEVTKSNGLKLNNASFFRNFSIPGATTTYTTGQQINLTAGSGTFTVQLIGGGGGGAAASGTTNASNGGTTTVQLRDGTTVLQTWTSPGGLGAPGSPKTGGTGNGAASAFGPGGAGGYTYNRYQSCSGGGEGYECNWYTTNATNGSAAPATSYGAGGGGGGGTAQGSLKGAGGSAAQVVEIAEYSVLGIASPNLLITVGTGGAGVSGSMSGAAGAGGCVKVTQNANANLRADVIPIEPTAIGSFVDNIGLFPNLGAGMWTLFTLGQVALNLHTIEMDGTTVHIGGWNEKMITFVSAKTPLINARSGTSKTVYYKFYKMGA